MTFNDHVGSTKSYKYTRDHHHDLAPIDFVPVRDEITASQEQGVVLTVPLHDGSVVNFRAVDEDYDPKDRIGAMSRYKELNSKGVVPTGLLFLDETGQDFHEQNNTVEAPLWDYDFRDLCPGNDALQELMKEFR